MKTTLIALLLLLSLLVGAVLGEVYTVRATNEILDLIHRDAAPADVREVLRKKWRIFSIMISHEELREVETALDEYELERSEENKSRLKDSIEHLKRLLFIGYFVKNS